MKILGLDSSGLVASVAIAEDDNLLGEYTVNYKKTHSQTLLPMLDEVARMIELDLSSIDAIAVAGGPGSFTGLRIGSATAKGLGLALEKPILNVPTVDALAYNLVGHRDMVCPLMDARRNQTYTGLYRFDGNDMQVLRGECAVGIDEIAADINSRGEAVVFLGDGVPVFKAYLEEQLTVPHSYAPARSGRCAWHAVLQRGKNGERGGTPSGISPAVPGGKRAQGAGSRKRKGKRMSIIRSMRAEDATKVASLEAEIFSQPWSENAFLDSLRLPDTIFLVAEESGVIQGYIGMYLAVDEGEITNVAVDPACRRRGIGEGLLTEMKKRATDHKIARIVLEVRVSNEGAIRLYEKQGFSSVGIRRGFYEFPREDARIMVCAL